MMIHDLIERSLLLHHACFGNILVQVLVVVYLNRGISVTLQMGSVLLVESVKYFAFPFECVLLCLWGK